MKVIIIGGVAGGATFLGRFRRLNEEAEIIMFEKGSNVSFANCGLPYYIGGKINDRKRLFVASKEDIEKKYNVKINLFCEVIQIDKENKVITYLDLKKNQIFKEKYDKLIISTGSSALDYEINSDIDNQFNLITIQDTDKIYEFIENKKPKSALVIGAGFIGLEICENLIKKGLDVTLLARNQIMSKIDEDISKLIFNTLKENGVNVILKHKAVKLSSESILDDGSIISSDLIIIAIGTKPNTKLFNEYDFGINNTIKTKNDYSILNNNDIYAIGDINEEILLVDESCQYIPLANLANKMGRYAADNINGLKREKKKSIRTSIIKVFDDTLAYCGVSEKDLIKQGKVYKKDYFFTIIHPYSSATYYPNYSQMTIKLIFDKERVLGAQIYGKSGVDKRIDVIATAIQFNASVKDLVDLELSYAPPFNQAKDPVNFAGYVALNILENLTNQVSIKEYLENKDYYTLLDVREKSEYKFKNYISEDANFIPLGELRSNLNKLDKNKHYLIYCAVGIRGYIAERILKQKGFKASNLMGGYLSWLQQQK